MDNHDVADDAQQTERTRATVMRYHYSWKDRDLDAVMALYHPDIQYNDFFQQRCMGFTELREYVRNNLPRQPGEALEHTDRIRIDGHTAFIQYRTSLHGSNGLLAFRTGEAITVRDGLIWRIHEYATLMREEREQHAAGDSRPALSRLGLSARQLGLLAQDLEEYMQREQAYLDPQLDLQQVATATGYSRNQISHLLNQVLGQSFYRYINQKRLQHLLNGINAKNDLQRIDDLAFAAGFNSLSAFYNCFRRHTGLSPKAYLKQISSRARTEDKP
ncbi:transcriptional regulator, AraC family [Pseudomonas guineae]|uniref:Transcriptional regulator, AraC family n=1 Tax=Pseudomonas guineae TaxID=425504 RepID=A0A1I3NHR3_9PSED|nr:nuclear transport factor 2 family protein [Pseudomonas guineae]SFJ08853.1 transcriptional regulator, AraC family [Pseudomonas guineae]